MFFILLCQFLQSWSSTTDVRQLQQQDQRVVHEARRHFMALSTRRDTAQASVTALMARLLDFFPSLVTEAIDEVTCNTALHNAARYGFADRAELLVKGGADVTALNKVYFM